MNITDAVRTLDRELHDIFGPRLQSLVVYASAGDTDAMHTSTLAIVDRLTVDDLRACAGRVASWHDAGVATPLLLETREFDRSLDAFPFEFDAILADHAIVSGRNPFDGLRVDPADMRRACEVQARSHLLHLREGFIETGGRGDVLLDLIRRSAAPLAALLKSAARLGIDTTDGAAPVGATPVNATPVGATQVNATQVNATLRRIAQLKAGSSLSADDARALFPTYLDAVERLTRSIDSWSAE